MTWSIQLIEDGILKKSYLELFRDIYKIIRSQYLHFDEKWNVLPAATYGKYFKNLFEDPLKYIIPQPELREVF